MVYIPRIKSKGFCPNPVAQAGGVPTYADAVSNPEVLGTAAYRDWWMEQFDICEKGYTTGGVFIPGRYYYYLNFCYLSTVGRGYHHPDYVDYDLEYAELVEEAKRINWGIIGLKRRRAGFSEKWVNMVANYGLRFNPEGYSAGIVSGLSNYSEELGKKLSNTNHIMDPALSLHIPKSGNDWEVYWVEELSNKKARKAGSFGKIKIRTANNNSGVLKGDKYDDVAFEESGEFDLLEETYGDSKSCFAVGDKMVGTPYIYGTGGNISKGSKRFREMWYNSNTHNLLKTEAYAGRLRNKYYIGSKNEIDEVEYDCPNIEKLMVQQSLSYEQVLGCEDVQHVEKTKVIKRAELLRSDSKIAYYKELQTDPFNEREAFLKFNANQYPLELLAAQEAELLSRADRGYSCFKPKWKVDTEGKLKFPLEVELDWIEAPTAEMGDYVMIHNDHIRPKKFNNMYYGGLDGYDIDSTQTSKSLGAMVICTRNNNIPNVPSRMPVCIIFCRPSRKERFYELCGMMSVRFELRGATMCDARSPGVIEWYKQNNLTRFLAKRPQSIESEHTEQIHDYGYKQTTFSKPIAIGKVQTWVMDISQHCEFPQLLSDIRDYDENAPLSESDSDLHDALQDCLVGMDDKPIHAFRGEPSAVDPFAIGAGADASLSLSDFEMLARTSPLTKSSGQIHDPFGAW